MRVFDCFTFFNELDVLEVRLRELYSVVDRFVLVEAHETHQGEAKPFAFQDAKERFAAYADKIFYVQLTTWPTAWQEWSDKTLGGMNRDDWRRENAQRNIATLALRQRLDAQEDDVVMVSDVDEIPRRDTVERLRRHFGERPGTFAVCTMPLYRFHWNCLDTLQCQDHPRNHWHGTYAVQYGDLVRSGNNMSRLRMLRHIDEHALIRDDVPQPNAEIEDAGWHFTWMGDYDAYVAKAKATLRHYAGNYDGEERTEGHYRGLLGKMRVVPVDDSFPEHIREGGAAHLLREEGREEVETPETEEVPKGGCCRRVGEFFGLAARLKTD